MSAQAVPILDAGEREFVVTQKGTIYESRLDSAMRFANTSWTPIDY